MKGHVLKPQDVLVALRLVAAGEADRTFPRLAASLGMSASEVHAAVKRAAVKRAVASGLVDEATRTTRKAGLLEFLVHGLRYVFPAEWSGVTRSSSLRETSATFARASSSWAG